MPRQASCASATHTCSRYSRTPVWLASVAGFLPWRLPSATSCPVLVAPGSAARVPTAPLPDDRVSVLGPGALRCFADIAAGLEGPMGYS